MIIFKKESRIKFPDQPEKFMESEMELHDAIQVSTFNQVPRIVKLNKFKVNFKHSSFSASWKETMVNNQIT